MNINFCVQCDNKLDPTLPRIYTVKCPNDACKTNASDESDAKTPTEVIYIRYDDANLKYLYICTTCDHVWRTDDRR
jgi:aspartate carbamoyltransferase regulatory subunit